MPYGIWWEISGGMFEGSCAGWMKRPDAASRVLPRAKRPKPKRGAAAARPKLSDQISASASAKS